MTIAEDSVLNIRRVGLRLAGELADGTVVTRGPRDTHWTKAAVHAPPAEQAPIRFTLRVIRENELPGDPRHWAIFIGESDSINGTVWQVRGDSQTGMSLIKEDNAPALASLGFEGDWIVATDILADQVKIWTEKLDETASSIAPPQNTRERNCQHWTVEVLKKLVTEGLLVSNKPIEPIEACIGEQTPSDVGSSFTRFLEDSIPHDG